MANLVTTGLYPYDPYGREASNRVDERQTLSVPGRDDYYFIIPRAAPFFTASLSVQNDLTKEYYVAGEDYIIGHYFADAMQKAGRAIAGSIRFLRRDISGIVRLQYQTVGGQWGYDDKVIIEELGNRLVNPVTRYWDQVSTLPATFPPVAHDHDVIDLIGWEEVVTAIGEINKAIASTSEALMTQHLVAFDNPHRVNKAQVGLGNVPNYAMSNVDEAAEGKRSDRLMSPYMTTEAIRAQIGERFDQHLQARNPHDVNALDVGLGNVPNLALADERTARKAESTDTLVSPFLVAAMIDELVGIRLTNHINNQQNPHGITPEAIGAYSADDMDAMLGRKLDIQDTAANAELVFGYTEDQLKRRILSGQANDSLLLDGRTYNEVISAVAATDSNNAIKFDGLTGDEWRTNLENATQAMVQNAFNDFSVSNQQSLTDLEERLKTEQERAIGAIVDQAINDALEDYSARADQRFLDLEEATTAETQARMNADAALTDLFDQLLTTISTTFDQAATQLEAA